MLTQAVNKRRKDCSALMFIAFMLACAVVIALPGFLYYYFWEGAGIPLSTFIGFLLGSFVLSLLEALGQVLAALRRMFRHPGRSKTSKTESNHGGEDTHA